MPGDHKPNQRVIPSRYVPAMELPDTHRQVLEALARRPPDLENIDPDVLEELRQWGMVMTKSFELTGMGRRYAGGSPNSCRTVNARGRSVVQGRQTPYRARSPQTTTPLRVS